MEKNTSLLETQVWDLTTFEVFKQLFWSLIPVLDQPIHTFTYWTIDPSIQKENKTFNTYSIHSN